MSLSSVNKKTIFTCLQHPREGCRSSNYAEENAGSVSLTHSFSEDFVLAVNVFVAFHERELSFSRRCS